MLNDKRVYKIHSKNQLGVYKMFGQFITYIFFNHPLPDEMIMKSRMSWMVIFLCQLFQHAFFQVHHFFRLWMHCRTSFVISSFLTSLAFWWCHLGDAVATTATTTTTTTTTTTVVAAGVDIFGFSVHDSLTEVLLQSMPRPRLRPFLTIFSSIWRNTGEQTDGDYRNDHHHTFALPKKNMTMENSNNLSRYISYLYSKLSDFTACHVSFQGCNLIFGLCKVIASFLPW